jgi:anti-sigma B factor antagonist
MAKKLRRRRDRASGTMLPIRTCAHDSDNFTLESTSPIMNLVIADREREGIVLLDFKGRITAGEEVSIFRASFEKVAARGDPKLILNLKEVDYIDSTGLGAMVMCSTMLRKAGGVAKLLQLNRRNLELLVLTKIDTIFEVFDDEIDAVNSFFPGREIKRFDILSFVRQLKEE